MKKVLILIGILILGMAAGAFAQEQLDAPHNITWDPTETSACNDCHNYFPYTDAVCLRCHVNTTGGGYTKTNALAVSTHSSAAITAAGLTPNPAYGTWSQQCVDCHWYAAGTHGQLQTVFNGANSYLVTGTITSITPDDVNDLTTFGYSSLQTLVSGWSDYTKWNAKTGASQRGLIMFASTSPSLERVNFEVTAATANTITVRGAIDRVYPAEYLSSINVGGTFALTYGQFINISANGNAVVFYTNQGPNSFAYDESGTGTDPTPNGICQVCHTETAHWRSNGTLANHNNGATCTECHTHQNGFAPTGGACNSCHGDPPTTVATLVFDPSATGATTPGGHSEHATTLQMTCATCHTGSVMLGSNPTPNNQISLGFVVNGTNWPGFLGSWTTGTYDSFLPILSPYTIISTSPGTIVTENGTNSCTNLYCHSNVQTSPPGGALTYATPTWGTATSGQCGTCHNADGVQGNGTLMSSGTHTIHLTSPYSYTCSQCHNGAGEGTPLHANYNIDLAFITDMFGNTGSYSNSSTPSSNPPGTAYGTCSNVYCHSIVQNNGGTPLTPGTNNYMTTPVWGSSTAIQCSNCHGSPPLTGGHGVHVSDGTTGYGYACGTCHYGAGDGTTLHANRIIDVAINPTAPVSEPHATYSLGSHAPGMGYGNCSNTYCHSDGTAVATGTIPPNTSPLWSGTVTCGSCHGAGNSTGQPSYTSGTPKANSHAAHPIDCSLCHYGTTTDGVTISTSTGYTIHANGSYNLLAKASASVSFSYSPATTFVATAGGTCSSISCHSGNNATWGATISCGGCHPVPPTTNAHAIHTGALTSSNAQYGVDNIISTATAYGFNCGNCHPLNLADHGDGIVEVELYNANATGFKLKNPPGASYSVTPGTTQNGTCSNVYCHSDGSQAPTYQTTPAWNGTYTASADECAQCHKNSPTGSPTGAAAHAAHVVGIHYNDIYTGSYGLATPGTGGTNSHGLATVSTTINCNVCHYNTVTSDANDKNTVCATCHGTTAPLNGNAAIANKIYHVTGVPNVAFAPSVLSKAQIRDSITTVNELNSSWARQNGYKGTNSYDQSQASLTPSYAPQTRTCSSVACHDGHTVNWDAQNITCVSCHTGLPQ